MGLENVAENYIQGARVMIGAGTAKDVVAIEGSVLGGPNHFEKGTGASFLAELLDTGTKATSKELLRESLSARGAHLTFWACGDRTYFSGGCFPEDVSFLLSLITECLSQAAFKPKEVASVRERMLGELAEEATKTKALSSSLLTRLLYPRKHPHYELTVSEKAEELKQIDRATLALHQKTFGSEGMILVVTGDVRETTVLTAVRRALEALPKRGAGVSEKASGKFTYKPSDSFIVVKDKANIDTYFGRPVAITAKSDEYLPFMVAASLLGGKGLSTGHLMRTIRERDGLTYGIYAMPTGFGDGEEGYFRIWATFSPDRFDHSVAATKKEIAIFLKTGMTESALASKKAELAGRYLISLSTTRGLAQALHQLALEERELAYLVDYPKLVAGVTLGAVKDAAVLFTPDELSIAASGTRSA